MTFLAFCTRVWMRVLLIEVIILDADIFRSVLSGCSRVGMPSIQWYSWPGHWLDFRCTVFLFLEGATVWELNMDFQHCGFYRWHSNVRDATGASAHSGYEASHSMLCGCLCAPWMWGNCCYKDVEGKPLNGSSWHFNMFYVLFPFLYGTSRFDEARKAKHIGKTALQHLNINVDYCDCYPSSTHSMKPREALQVLGNYPWDF